MVFLWAHTYLISSLISHRNPLDASTNRPSHEGKDLLKTAWSDLFWISRAHYSCQGSAATRMGGRISWQGQLEIPPVFFSPLWFLLTFTGHVTIFLCFFSLLSSSIHYCPHKWLLSEMALVIMTHCHCIPCPFFLFGLIKSRVLWSETIHPSIHSLN